MQLRALFDNQVTLLNSVITTAQADSSFQRVCNLFFSKIHIIYKIDTLLEIYEGYQDTTNALGLGIGNFEIVSVYNHLETRIKVRPLDYANFDLLFSYVADFEMVCELIIDAINKDNLDMLKGGGVEGIETTTSMQFEEVMASLSKKHSVEVGEVIL